MRELSISLCVSHPPAVSLPFVVVPPRKTTRCLPWPSTGRCARDRQDGRAARARPAAGPAGVRGRGGFRRPGKLRLADQVAGLPVNRHHPEPGRLRLVRHRRCLAFSLRGQDTAVAFVLSMPSWLRQCFCLVLPLPSWLRRRLCLCGRPQVLGLRGDRVARGPVLHWRLADRRCGRLHVVGRADRPGQGGWLPEPGVPG